MYGKSTIQDFGSVGETKLKSDACQNMEKSGVRQEVLEVKDYGGQGSIWSVVPLEREKESKTTIVIFIYFSNEHSKQFLCFVFGTLSNK